MIKFPLGDLLKIFFGDKGFVAFFRVIALRKPTAEIDSVLKSDDCGLLGKMISDCENFYAVLNAKNGDVLLFFWRCEFHRFR